ncbi:MAG TPA: hypothetical protein VML75_22465 [Kofleriaceae bacterium]|nr:hypothetical protein [Kofleriaceae bacterium]
MRGVALAGLAFMIGCGSSRAEPPAAAPVPSAPPGEVRAVAANELEVTHGTVLADGAGLRIEHPAVRAVIPGAHGDTAELRFVYAGPTAKRVALASGEMRGQVGLKLRADDGCNLVYVMWRLGHGVVVSIKRNPGDRVHAECGTRGYRNLRPERRIAVAMPEIGSAHRLEATIVDGVLTARLDGRQVWRGRLGALARGLEGAPGLRTDNVVLEDIELRADVPARVGVAAAPGR